MKPKRSINVTVLVIGILIVSNLLWLIIALSNKTFPYGLVRNIYHASARTYEVFVHGKREYTSQLIANQGAVKIEDNPSTVTIESSVLPLYKTYYSLADSVFAKNGGAITNIGNQLLVMDRLGRFYVVDGDNSRKLSIILPNNVESYLLQSKGAQTVGPDALRAQSIVYDEATAKVYVSFTRYDGDSIIRLVVASISVSKNPILLKGGWSIVFESEPFDGVASVTHSGGGKLIIYNHALYLSIGYSFEKIINNELYASSLDIKSQRGKIYKIDLADGRSRLYSIGHRNIQGMAIYQDSLIIATEHGPQGGDEINIIRDGYNYGWPLRTYGTRYGTYDYAFRYRPVKGTPMNFSEPFYVFTPSIAISSIIQVKNFHRKWDGDLLIGSLKAQTLYRLKLFNGRVIFQEPIWIGHRIRDAIQFGDRIYILTDDSYIITLSIDIDALKKNVKGNNLVALNPKLSKCIRCHQFGRSTPISIAPSLANIYGRKIGSDNFQRYSDPLLNTSGNWDDNNLKRYLVSPNDFVPGTTMPEIQLREDEIDDIIALLMRQ
jgi:cytochrome c2